MANLIEINEPDLQDLMRTVLILIQDMRAEINELKTPAPSTPQTEPQPQPEPAPASRTLNESDGKALKLEKHPDPPLFNGDQKTL